MAIIGTYQRIAILDCSSGIQMETYDSHAELLLGLLQRCDLAELARLRTDVIPEIEKDRARLEAEWNEEEDPS